MMRFASLLALALTATSAQAADSPRAAAALARALEGRTAGAPVDCITQREIRSTRIIDGTAILYEVSSGTLYVNVPDSGAQSLRDGLISVTDTHSGELCSIDTVKLVDSGSEMFAGVVGLGKFVPYARPKKR